MTIDEIYNNKKISVRTYNICKSNDLNTISEIKDYYFKNRSFEKLQNCGRKSNMELIGICVRYMSESPEKENSNQDNLEENKKDSFKKIIDSLTRVQREVINSFIIVNTEALKARSKNAIKLFLRHNLKIKNFANRILLSKDFEVSKIKNIGARSIPEISDYILGIKNFIFEISQSEDEKYLISRKNIFLIQCKFHLNQIPSEILESESIFQLTDFLLNQNALFDKNQTIIIKKALNLFNNQKGLMLDEIAEQVDLSRERVRQIRKLCLDDLFQKLLFISNFNDDLFQKYSIDIESMYIEINTDILDKINQSNNTNFSKEFVTYILSAYLRENFTLVGNYEDVLQPKYFNSRNKHDWINFYLVDRKLASEIDFISLTNDISNRISDRIEESYSFNFKSYLSKFLTNNNINVLDLLFPICEKIINDEFEIYLNLDENINFKRNTYRQAHEYAYEALENLKKPSKVKEIFEKIIEIHPNYDTDEEKIRSSMKRKNGFVPIGRKSVYALKKWENELINFKGGTIRQIVEGYLNRFDEPKTYEDITSYVLKFRPKSNLKSIVYNLKLEESGIFKFYQNTRIGLSNKKYDKTFIIASNSNYSEKKSWEERFEMLQNFVLTEKRLPFSNGVPEKEIKLYRWLNVQKSKQNKGKLAKNKLEKLNSLLTKYPSINGRRRLNSNEKYQELISFVSNNHRLPSANKNGEENLYQFFYKQRKLFDKNELDSKEESKFIEVAKLLQNIKYENKRN